MKRLMKNIRPAVTLLAVFTVICGGLYPIFCTYLLQALFPEQANGSIIKDGDGKILGSELIGQNFTANKYFWGRVSATQSHPYNAAVSGGSNLGSNNPALIKAWEERVKSLKKADPKKQMPIPADLVMASGSGLDPHISPAAAEYQIARVAQARGMKEDEVRRLIEKYSQGRQLGFLGEPVVNVLLLNLALDGKIQSSIHE